MALVPTPGSARPPTRGIWGARTADQAEDMSTTRAPAPGHRTPTLPGSRTRNVLTLLTVGWLLAYAGLRIALTVLGPPSGLSAIGTDLVVLAGWPGVAVLLGRVSKFIGGR